jgi:hypothetical protein
MVASYKVGELETRDFIYLYGGVDTGGDAQQNLWRYTVATGERLYSIKNNGRKFFCCIGIATNKNQFHYDRICYFLFSFFKTFFLVGTWSLLPPGVAIPPARSSSAIGLFNDNTKLVMYGGIINSGITPDLWIYDLTSTYIISF